MKPIATTLACNLDTNILLAALPLFHAEEVEAIEWSFDALFRAHMIPDWFSALIKAYADEKRLIGHGVFFSIFSGKWYQEQEEWLLHLERVAQQYQFQHITEHFGFMTGENFHAGAPLSIPLTEKTKVLGQDRLKRIAQACQCPVGLENLAFAFSLDDVKSQGAFLEALLEPVNGFIILDLHNLYCQLYNFETSFKALIASYPLDRVREIHISGGSWEYSSLAPHKRVRRDTHDEAVPVEVFELLEQTIPLCPNLQYVVLEQIGTGLVDEQSRLKYQEDFRQLRRIVKAFEPRDNQVNDFLPRQNNTIHHPPIQDPQLHVDQLAISRILEQAPNYKAALDDLHSINLFHPGWQIEKWSPYMIETAMAISRKWKNAY